MGEARTCGSSEERARPDRPRLGALRRGRGGPARASAPRPLSFPPQLPLSFPPPLPPALRRALRRALRVLAAGAALALPGCAFAFVEARTRPSLDAILRERTEPGLSLEEARARLRERVPDEVRGVLGPLSSDARAAATTGAGAAVAAPRPLRLEDALAMALRDPDRLEIAAEGLTRAHVDVIRAYGWFLPEVRYRFSYARQDPGLPALASGERPDELLPRNRTSRFTLTQPLFRGLSEVFNLDRAYASREAAELDLLSARARVVEEVSARFYDALEADAALRHAEAAHALWSGIARALERAGAAAGRGAPAASAPAPAGEGGRGPGDAPGAGSAAGADARAATAEEVAASAPAPPEAAATAAAAAAAACRLEARRAARAVIEATERRAAARDRLALLTGSSPAAPLEPTGFAASERARALAAAPLETVLEATLALRPDLEALRQRAEAARFEARMAYGEVLPEARFTGNLYHARDGIREHADWDAALEIEAGVYEGWSGSAAVARAESRSREAWARYREAARAVLDGAVARFHAVEAARGLEARARADAEALAGAPAESDALGEARALAALEALRLERRLFELALEVGEDPIDGR